MHFTKSAGSVSAAAEYGALGIVVSDNSDKSITKAARCKTQAAWKNQDGAR